MADNIEVEAQQHVATLREMAKDCHEIGAVDLIDHIPMSNEVKDRVFDILLGLDE